MEYLFLGGDDKGAGGEIVIIAAQVKHVVAILKSLVGGGFVDAAELLARALGLKMDVEANSIFLRRISYL